MHHHLYHARRLILSYSYEYLLLLISWAVGVPRQFYLILLFGLSCITAGIAFSLHPITMSGYFGFENLNIIALTDIRAYYGTMLIAIGIALMAMANNTQTARAALVFIAAFSLGSACGRLLGLFDGVPIISIHGLLFPIEIMVAYYCRHIYRASLRPSTPEPLPILNPKTPEEFRPLSAKNFSNPYAYYKMLRDDYPLYKMPGEHYYMVSRYQDIINLAKDTEHLSSKLVEILATGRPKNPNQKGPSIIERMGNIGIIPVDVFALQDPPVHTAERKIGHSGFNAKFIKSLEADVEQLCTQMMDEFMPQGNVEFVQDFAWRFPMTLIIDMLGFDKNDYEDIKGWCVDGIKSLSGTATQAESIAIGASAAQFMRYLWKGYLHIKNNPADFPDDCFSKKLALLADDPDSVMTDQRAIATIFQLLIAGSDSSASSMGSAIRVIAENPEIEKELRSNPDKIDAFIEEIFRTESAFQGHFRLTKKPLTIHGVTLPAASRVFLMWASGNRDERFWDNPEAFEIGRKNGKKHLTFGHGVHACLGRELARMEIRIVIRQLLERTTRLVIVGDTPYEASIFARTMVALPLAFERKDENTMNNKTQSPATAEAP